MKKVIEEVARRNGVPAEKVRMEIAEMINIGLSSDDPEAIQFWSQFGGRVPVPEEFIYALTVYVRTKMN